MFYREGSNLGSKRIDRGVQASCFKTKESFTSFKYSQKHLLFLMLTKFSWNKDTRLVHTPSFVVLFYTIPFWSELVSMVSSPTICSHQNNKDGGRFSFVFKLLPMKCASFASKYNSAWTKLADRTTAMEKQLKPTDLIWWCEWKSHYVDFLPQKACVICCGKLRNHTSDVYFSTIFSHWSWTLSDFFAVVEHLFNP